MKILLQAALLSAALVIPAAATAAPQAAANASAPTAKAKGVWIDVRSPEEFSRGHLQGALNIPGDQIARRISAVSPDKNAPVNLYCRSGGRAEAALQELKKQGYTNVTNHGGYQDLIDKGIR
ncbi:MAG: rhodanese-like domain-containing protein [Neisseria sp.]|nr:rhodanese-like domain-containing protein [Neisseria sp.]